MPHHSWFLLKQGLKRIGIFMRLQYCFGPIVIDTNGSWCLSLKPCFSKRDETSVRSVNRVGEIYVGERETKGNQSFRKMFALQTTSTSLRLLSKTPEDERRKTSLNSSQQLSSPQWSEIENSIWKFIWGKIRYFFIIKYSTWSVHVRCEISLTLMPWNGWISTWEYWIWIIVKLSYY